MQYQMCLLWQCYAIVEHNRLLELLMCALSHHGDNTYTTSFLINQPRVYNNGIMLTLDRFLIMLELSIEQQILIAMRKTLAAVVKDVTPLPGMKHPLSDSTIADIRACFALISAREQEIARHDERPQYADAAPSAQIIPLASLKRRTNQTDDH